MLNLNKRTILLVQILVLSLFISCSDNGSSPKNENVLIINDFKMTQQEFRKQCINENEYNNRYKTSKTGKQNLLNCIIEKELFIQEAKRLGIDKDKKFTAAIEKYWEATLIKLLMERKNMEIKESTLVSDKEIIKRYNEHRIKAPLLPPLTEIEEELAAEILETKKTRILEAWIDTLHKNATIKIGEKFLTE